MRLGNVPSPNSTSDSQKFPRPPLQVGSSIIHDYVRSQILGIFIGPAFRAPGCRIDAVIPSARTAAGHGLSRLFPVHIQHSWIKVFPANLTPAAAKSTVKEKELETSTLTNPEFLTAPFADSVVTDTHVKKFSRETEKMLGGLGSKSALIIIKKAPLP